jgi:hypothetical protein
MRAEKETLSTATASLARTLRGDGTRAWAAGVERAVADVEQSARNQICFLGSPDGGVFDVGTPHTTPGLYRRVGQLQENLRGLVAQMTALRSDLRQAMASLAPGDFEEQRRRANDLLDALKAYTRAEANLIFESASLEVGAGD